jgi:hypothetical protein
MTRVKKKFVEKFPSFYFSAKGFFMGPCGVWFLHLWCPGPKSRAGKVDPHGFGSESNARNLVFSYHE